MKKYYHGRGRYGSFFEGWYFKCTTRDGRSIAFIPAVHINEQNHPSASLQIICEEEAWNIDYPAEKFSASQSMLSVILGPNRFSERGIKLNTERPGLKIQGHVAFSPFTELRSDIMGPFRFIPGMECSHGVISMSHSLSGSIVLNGGTYDFTGGIGYIETDRGRSFPSSYLWIQCHLPEGSLMLSIARIPYAGLAFTGCICAIIHGGREYRLATYRGAAVEEWTEEGALIRQGKYLLKVKAASKTPKALRAPIVGAMDRVVYESLDSKVNVSFSSGDMPVFKYENLSGSFEYSKLSR